MSRLRVDGVFDIECAGWDRFIVGEILTVDGDRYVTKDPDDFYRELRSRKGTYYAHAGGRYDALFAIDCAVRHRDPWTARLRGSGAISVRIGSVTLRDSAAVWPDKLATVARIAGMEKLETGLACECGKECGGYCVLERPLSDAEWGRVIDYLHRDCDVLLSALMILSERAEADDIDLRGTVGGSAWATAKRWCDLSDCTHDLGEYRRVREGYYGGRVEVYRLAAESGHRYDIHSSYPAALSRTPLPVGLMVSSETPRAARQAWNRERPGIYGAQLEVPESLSPPLPVRMSERLIYPHGPIQGVWTGLELRHAIECGARLIDIDWAYTWPRSEPVLAPYADRIWSVRDSAANGGAADKAYAKWVKWVANSLTGKLGQRPEHATHRFLPAGDDAPEVAEDEVIVRVLPSGVVVQRETARVDACAHVQWAAYLTAEARCELHRQLVHAAERGAPVYCDTDSVYATTVLDRRIGPDLGEWGYEGRMSDWRALAPKVYRYRDGDGEDQVKAKGMSGLDTDGFDALARGESWTAERGVVGLKTALRSRDDGIFRRKRLTRSLRGQVGWCGGRIVEKNLSTRAPTVIEYRDHFE